MSEDSAANRSSVQSSIIDSAGVKGSYAADSPLGLGVAFVPDYSPDILHLIDRARYRESIAALTGKPFAIGYDEWRCYELSALLPSGKPIQATASMRIPASSESIVESKSLKLYLNSWNSRFVQSIDDFESSLRSDLSSRLGADVDISLAAISELAMPGFSVPLAPVEEGAGQGVEQDVIEFRFRDALLLDSYDPMCSDYQRNASLLSQGNRELKSGVFYSHLLRSNCPVTGQPDWASLIIAFDGSESVSSIASLSPALDPEQVLRYVVSFRDHDGFHEQTVEQIYCDLLKLGFSRLAVCAQYTRRGGIDITPIRTTGNVKLELPRFNRL